MLVILFFSTAAGHHNAYLVVEQLHGVDLKLILFTAYPLHECNKETIAITVQAKGLQKQLEVCSSFYKDNAHTHTLDYCMVNDDIYMDCVHIYST